MNSLKSFGGVQQLVPIVVFSVLSALGGMLKIPSPLGSIALDSAPGYFCAAYFNPLLGGIVGFLGHLSSALSAGFPLGFNHIVIAINMFVYCFCFGFISHKINSLPGLAFASVICIIMNTLIPPIVLVFIPINPMSISVATTIVPFLLIASAANIILAALAYRTISRLNIPGL